MPHTTGCAILIVFGLFYYVATCQVRPPLHLTPYLRQGQVAAARELSLVVDKEGIIPTSHAGFMTVNQMLMNHLFFWFFPALNGDPVAPLVIWLNGGPGVPSMVGLFHENGPLKLSYSARGKVSYERRSDTWAKTFSMLYIDSPVGTGYSYSESGEKGYRKTQAGYSKDLYEFIEQFYIMFPEYLKRDLYIGGQSYAGKYVPAFAHKIHEEILANKSSIPLKGIYLGGPFMDPETQTPHYYDLYYALGYISYRQKLEFETSVKSFLHDVISGRESFVLSDWVRLFPRVCESCWDNLATLEKPPYDAVAKVMRKIKTNVHANTLKFKHLNINVYKALTLDCISSTKLKLANLLNSYKVLIFTGDMDGIITSPMVEAALMSTPWSLQSEYNSSIRKVWNVSGRLRGFYTQVGRFCRVTMHRAGHQSPYDQPDTTILMMSQFISGGCVS